MMSHSCATTIVYRTFVLSISINVKHGGCKLGELLNFGRTREPGVSETLLVPIVLPQNILYSMGLNLSPVFVNLPVAKQ
jgi:hypothetical protein